MLKGGERFLTMMAPTQTLALTSGRIQNIRLPPGIRRCDQGGRGRQGGGAVRRRLQGVRHHVAVVTGVDLQHGALPGLGVLLGGVDVDVVRAMEAAVAFPFSSDRHHHDDEDRHAQGEEGASE